MEQQRRSKRRRKCCVAGQSSSSSSSDGDGLQVLLKLLKNKNNTKVVVFTGSGISVSAGLSTFSKGLYARAAKRLGLLFKLRAAGDDGRELFRYRFFKEKPLECFSFFAELQKEAAAAKPTFTHQTLKTMEQSGQLVRHYTMNIDGLATTTSASSSLSCGVMTTTTTTTTTLPWHPNENPEGKTVELHGSLHEWVCRRCQEVTKITTTTTIVKKKKPAHCDKCGGQLRFRVLLYDDEEGHLIIHHDHSNNNPLDGLLRQDLAGSQAVLWIGISFEQSASCEHFRKVWETLQNQNNQKVPCFIINPEASDALFHLQTAVGGLLIEENNDDNNRVYTVHSSSDDFFEQVMDDF